MLGKNKKQEYAKVNSFEILRVKSFKNAVFFDIKVNDVCIYGCRAIEGQNGDFIGFPSEKGKDGKFYNKVYIALSPEDTAKIIAAVSDLL